MQVESREQRRYQGFLLVFLGLLITVDADNAAAAAVIELDSRNLSALEALQWDGGYDELKPAITALMQGRFRTAEVLSRAAVERSPESADAWQVLGYAMANLERYEEAIAALEEAAVRYSSNGGPLVTQGEIHLHLGQLDRATRAFERALEVDPDNPRALENLGRLSRAAGEFDDAVSYFERAIDLAPENDPVPRAELALLYIQLGEPEAAQVVLSPWSDLPEGTSDRIMALLGKAAADMDQQAEAKTYLEARLGPDAPPEAFVDLATLHRNALNFTDAESVLVAALDRFPHSAVLWNELGRTYGGEGRYQAARTSFDKGLEAAPGTLSLLRGLRLSEFRLGQLDAAYEQAVTLAAHDAAESSDHLWLGSIEQARGNDARAIAAYSTAVEMDPENWVARNNLAALMTETDPDQAVLHARAAASLAGDATPVRETLAWALLRSGAVVAAHEAYASLAADRPDDPIIAYRHGLSLLEVGQKAEGRAEVDRALSLDAAFRHADEARALLSH